MKYKKIIILLILVIFLFTMAAASAGDVNNTAIASQDTEEMELSSNDGIIEDNLQISENNNTLIQTDDKQIVTGASDSQIMGAGEESDYMDLMVEAYNGKLTKKIYHIYDGRTSLGQKYDTIRLTNSFDGNGAIIDVSHASFPIFDIMDDKTIVIKNLTIIGSKSTGGGGAIYSGSHATTNLIDCTFINCSSSTKGGAVFMQGRGSLTNCIFINNHADGKDTYAGGAVYFQSGASPGDSTSPPDYNNMVTDCTFIGNSAFADGGALYVRYGIVTNCNFVNNKATGDINWGGAVNIYSGIVTKCNFTNNYVSEDGSAVYFSGRSGEVINCNFNNNSASNDGGAVYFTYSGDVTNCNFNNNHAGRNGGALKSEMGNVRNCNFSDNSAVYGGAVSYEYNGEIINCNFNNNTAEDGGAVNLYSGNVRNCNFTNNTAIMGGAVYFKNEGAFSDCIFTNNYAIYGGALYAEKNLNVKDCKFYNNRALYDGGAINFEDYGNVVGCEFNNNIVTKGNGGAVYMDSGSVTSSSFSGNNATAGSAIYFSNSNSKTNNTISNSIFLDNRADVDTYNPLQVTLNDNKIEIIFSGQNNLINAIYSDNDIDIIFTNVIYWSSNGISTTGPNPVKPSRSTREAGQNITVGFVDNSGVVFNDVFVTNNEGKIILNQNLNSNFYISIRHDEDTYYTSADYIFPNMKIYVNVNSLTTNNMTVNLTANSNIYNEVVNRHLQFVLPDGSVIDANYGANGTWWAEYTFDNYGVYPISAICDEFYYLDVQYGTVTITDAYSELTLEDLVLRRGETYNLTVKTKNATGITAMIDGKEVNVVNNFTIPISGLDGGNHTLTVTTIPVFGYNPVTKNATITVIRTNTNISADVTFGEVVNDVRITATVDPSATGFIEFVIGDKLVNVPVTKGKAVYELYLPFGDYDVDVYYSGDSVFNPNSTSKSFTVKENSKLDTKIIAVPMVDGKDVSIMIVVTDGDTSDITNYLYSLIKITSGSEESGESGSVDYSALAGVISGIIGGGESGESDWMTDAIGGIIGSFMGGSSGGDSGDDDLTGIIKGIAGLAGGYYGGATGSMAATTAVDIISGLISGGSSSGGSSGESGTSGSTDATGAVTVEIKGVKYLVDLQNGKCVFYSTFEPGEYAANIAYPGDDNYKGSSTITTFKVEEPSKLDTKIIAVPMVDGKDVSIMIVVTDGDTSDITNYLYSLIKITSGSEESGESGSVDYSALAGVISGIIGGGESGESDWMTDAIGGIIGSFMGGSSGGDSGDDDLTGIIKGIAGLAGGYYGGATGSMAATTAVDIISGLISGGSSSGGSSGESGTSGSTDATGAVTVEIKGVKYLVDLQNGKCVFYSTFEPGEYAANIAYPGDDNYKGSSTITTFKVEEPSKLDTKIIAVPMVDGKDVSIMIVVTDGDTSDITNYLYSLIKITSGSEESGESGSVDYSALAGVISGIIGGGESGESDWMTDAIGGIIGSFMGGSSGGDSGDDDLTGIIKGIAGLAGGYYGGATGSMAATTAVDIISGLISGGSSSGGSSGESGTSGSTDATGAVTVEIKGVKYLVDLQNGKCVFYSTFEPGEYAANIAYPGDDNYKGSSTITTFKVEEPSKLDTKIIAVPMVDGKDVSIMIVVTAEDTSDITNYIYGLIKVTGESGESGESGGVDYSALAGVISGIIGGDESGGSDWITDSIGGIIGSFMGGGSSGGSGDDDLTGIIKGIAGLAGGYYGGAAGSMAATTAVDIVSGLISGGSSSGDSSGSGSSGGSSGSSPITGTVTLEIKGVKYLVDLNNGMGVFYSTFEPGKYDAGVEYGGDENYNPSSTMAEFTVEEPTKADVEITARPSVNNRTVTINIKLESDLKSATPTGYVTIAVLGQYYLVPVVSGTASFSNEFPPATYDANVVYMGDDKFNTASTDVSFTVVDSGSSEKKNTPINADVNVNDNDVTITATVSPLASGIIEFNVAGKAFYAPVNNGRAVYNTNLTAGNYNVYVTYLGDTRFNPNSTSVRFTVAEHVKKDPSIKASASVEGQDVSITVEVDDDATGYVEFTLDNNKLYVKVSDGEAVLKTRQLPGKYTVPATYLGDDNYNSKSTSVSFEILEHVKNDTEIEANPSVNGTTVTIVTTVDEAATGNVTIDVVGQTFLVPVSKGKAVFTYDFFPATYSAIVKYLGDDNFNEASTTTSFTVLETSPEMKNTTIEVNVTTVDNNVTITATVNKLATGLIEFNIEGQAVYLPVNNGQAVYDVNLPAGAYTVVVTYMGDDKFNPNSTSADFEVSDHIKQNTTIDANASVAGYDVTVTAEVNENATGFIEFALNNTVVAVKVVDGVAVWETFMSPGEYTVTATYLGDDEFNSNATDVSFVVEEMLLENTPIDAIVSIIDNNVTITVNVNERATGFVKFNVSGPENYVLYMVLSDGKVVLEDVLSVGNYTADITYMGDENFNPNITSVSFEILGHIKKDTPITVEPDVNETEVTINVGVDENATGYVTIEISGRTVMIPVEDGKAVFTYDFLPGTYSANVKYLGDDNFNEASANTSFTVSEISPKLRNTTIDVNVTTVENNVTITATVDKLATGLIEFNIAGQAVYLAVNNGQATISNLILPANTYTVVVTYLGDDKYNPNATSAEFEVLDHIKQNTTIEGDAAVTGYNVAITVEVNENATGFVQFALDNKVVAVKVVDGVAVWETFMSPGEYTVTATYLGDDEFNSNATDISFVVEEMLLENTTIDAIADIVGNNVTITVNVDPNATGLIMFEVTGAENYTVYMAIDEGKVVLEDVLTVGEYLADITYLGDENYNPNSTSISFEVLEHVKKDTPISAVTNVNKSTVTIDVGVDENATGYVTIDILGQTFMLPVEDGKAVFTYDFFPGIYSANVKYLGDENFNNASTTASFSVFETSDELKNTNIDVNVTTVENDVTITATVNQMATGLIEFNIAGQVVYLAVNNGQVVYNLNLPANTYTVVITYMGDEKFNPNATSAEFEVTDHIKQNTTIESDVSVAGYDVTISAKINENATGFVEFALDGKVVVIRAVDGVAVWETFMNPGEYTVTATYLGNDEFNSNATDISVIVKEIFLENTTVDADVNVIDNNVTITVNVNPNATGFVRFDVSGAENYTVYLSIDDGKVVLEDVLIVGEYTADITYMGDENFNPNATTVSFEISGHVKKDTPISAVPTIDQATVTIDVGIDENATGFVTIEILGQTVMLPVEDGKASFTYDFLPATYSANVNYLGDDNFNNASTTVSFTVFKTSSELKNTPIDVNVTTVENNVTITATVSKMATGLIEFNIDGQSVYLAVNNGQAVYNVNLPARIYTVAVTYMGNDKFNPNATSAEFEVREYVKQNTTIDADASVTGYNVTITVEVNENATGFVEFTLDNKVVAVNVNDGVAVWDTVMLPGEYTVTATYLGDDEFNSNTTDISFVVNEIFLENTTVDADVNVIDNNVTITVNVNPNATGFVRFDVSGAENYTVYMVIDNGKVVLEDMLNVGNYTADITYMGDENFNPNITSVSFEILGHIKKDTPITAVPNVDKSVVTVNVGIDENATGYVTIEVLGQTFMLPVEDGKAVFTYDFFPATYSANVNYLGDDNFNAASTTVSFTVLATSPEMKNTTIEVNVTSEENNVTITAAVNPRATGLVEFNIEGQSVYIAVNNGQATISNLILPAKTYTVAVTYLGDDKFNPNATSTEFEVREHIRENTSIEADVSVSGYNAVISVAVNENATGYVKFDITGNKNYTLYLAVSNGKVVLGNEFDSGNYTAEITYMGDENFYANTTSVSFEVLGHVKKDTPISAVSTVNQTTVTIGVGIDENATGFVTIEILGQTVMLPVEDGKASFTYDFFPATYSANVNYLGDDNFNNASTTTSFTVFETSPELRDTPIDVDVTAVENNVTITATVSKMATGLIEFNIEGQAVYIAVNNGQATISNLILPAKTYTVAVTYLGDDKYNPNATSAEFEVRDRIKQNTTIEGDAVVSGYNVAITVEVNENATGFVEFVLDNKVVAVKVIDGVAVWDTVMLPGEYTVTAKYLGDDEFNSNTTDISVIVKEIFLENTTVNADVNVIDNNVTITVNVNPNATGFVRFDVSGAENYTVYMVIDNGKVVLEDMLNVGNYTADITYMGDENFNPNITSVSFEIAGHIKKDTPITALPKVDQSIVTIDVGVDENATGYVTIEVLGQTFMLPVEDGKAVFTYDFFPGIYSANVKYLGDDNFNVASTTVSFTVFETSPELKNTTIEVNVTSEENNVTITAAVNPRATGLVEFNIEGQSVYIAVNNGQATISNLILPAKTYTVAVTYLGDDKFNPNATSTEFEVREHIRENTPIEADVSVSGYNTVISVEVNENATGYVKFDITGNKNYTLYLAVSNGKVVLGNEFDSGNYTAEITYMGDENFYANTTSVSFEVLGHVKKDTPISAVSTVNQTTVTINVGINENATGFVTIEILGQTVMLPVENGKATFTYDFRPATYSANVNYLGDDNYNANSTSVSFTVLATSPEMKNTTINVNVTTVENNVTITATVNQKATGLIEFNIEGKTVYLPVNNGQATYNINLPTNTYTVAVTYLGDDKYNPNATSAEFEVRERIKQNTTIEGDAAVSGYNVAITVEINENATGFVEFVLDSKVVAVKVIDGVAVWDTVMLPGEYTVTATYLGDDEFNSNATDISVIVKEIFLENTTVNADVNVIDNNVTITVNVNPNATGFVRFDVSGAENYTVYMVIDNGKVVLEDMLNVGNYTADITYMGDENFNPNITSVSFEIAGHIKKDTPITALPKVDQSIVTIDVGVDENATGYVTIEVLGQTFMLPVEDGKAVFTYDFFPATYSANVKYLGDENFNVASTTVSFTVFETSPELKNTTIDVNVTSEENNVIITAAVNQKATGLIEFNIEGKTVYLAVNNGQATYNINLPANTYTVAATYLGDDKFNPNATSASFEVLGHIKKDTPINAASTVNQTTVTIDVDINENATGYVTIEILGQTVMLPVENGKATFTYDFRPATYSANVNYLGDDNYNANSTSVSFTVLATSPEMKNTTIDVNVTTVENNVTITATVNQKATGLIEFNIEGKTVYLPVNNGQATYNINLPANTYTVAATYLGDDKFNPNATSASFEVLGHIKKDTPINAASTINQTTVTIDVDINENATGFVTIEISGQTVMLPVENGKATFTYDFRPATYSANVKYLGDDNFNNASTTTSFTVFETSPELKNTTIDVNVTTVENNVTITATVNQMATGLIEFNIDGQAVYLAVNNGQATIYNLNLPANTYTVAVTYLGDDKFNPNATSASFEVLGHIKKDTPINAVSTVNQTTVTIDVDINENATGFVTIEISGQTVMLPVENGKASFTYDFRPATYSANVKYLGDDNYNANSTSVSFTVIENVAGLKNTTLNVDVVSAENDVTITAEVNPLATGLIEFNIDGKAVYIPVNNGKAVYEVVLQGGDYNVTVTYLGDSKFNPNSTVKAFTVVEHIKKNTNITSDVALDRNNVTLTVNVNKDAGGFVKFTLDDYDVFAKVVDGKAFINIVVPPGYYDVTAVYLGDDDFKENSTVISFIVSGLESSDVNIIVPDNVKEGDDVNVTVEIYNATGNASVIIDGTEIIVQLINGSANISIENISAGDHSVVVVYPGDETHDPAYGSSSFNAKSGPGKIVTEFTDIVINDKVVSVVLRDDDGNAIAGANISYMINGIVRTAVTDNNGSFSMLGDKGVVIIVDYAGDDKYLPTNISINFDSLVPITLATQFNISEDLIINTYAVDFNVGERGPTFHFQLTDSNGKPIANAPVLFSYKTVLLNRTTDENGIVFIGVSTQVAGSYICSLTYLGNETYNATHVGFYFKLAKKPITITAKAKTYKASTKTKKYTVTLKTSKCASRNGKVYLKSGKKVTLKVNGKTYVAKTNSKGQATFKITKLTKRGRFVTKIKFAGDKTYKSVTKTVKLTIK